jgi:hypothetical protein
MAGEDRAGRKALERCRARVVGVERGERGRARDPRERAEENERQDERGERELVEEGRGVVRNRCGDGKPAELDGQARSTTALVEIAASSGCPRRRAASIPSTREAGTASTRAYIASSSELPSRSSTSGRTGCCNAADVPQSPVTNCESQLT